MEGGEEIGSESLVEGNLTRQGMVEEREDILPVTAMGCCRHPQEEGRAQMGKHLLVGGGPTTMDLVDDHIVEPLRRERIEHLILGKGVDGTEEVGCLTLPLPSPEHSALHIIGEASGKDRACFLGDLLPMDDEEETLWPGTLDIGDSEQGLAGARCRNDQGLGLPLLPEPGKIIQRLYLHCIGLEADLSLFLYA